MDTAVAQQATIPAEFLGELHKTSSGSLDVATVTNALENDGYLYVPGFFNRDDALHARLDIFHRLAAMGEIAQPVSDGRFTGQSYREERTDDLGEFWREVSESWALRRLSHGSELHQLMDTLLGVRSRVQDYIFLRPAGPGKHTNLHCDYPFFTRTTETVATAWIALSDVPIRMGPLFVVEGSHKYADVIKETRGFDVSVDKGRTASRPETPLEFARERGTRLLTTNFRAGDIVVFNMFLLHGAFDNVSTDNEVRLSCDVRYQDAAAELDPRYFGANPTGTTGASYGELVGAKPMTADWHQR